MTMEEPPLSSTTTSPLHKPLHLLTEDDISQVTREQCRQYLKQKGMRRPSWNKSQAIQQVIMLKALLEPTPESDGCSRRLHITHRQQETQANVWNGTSADTEVSVSADESVPRQRNDTDHSDLPGDNDFVPPGIAGVTDEVKGQMTIFYSGKVNVYDDIPAEKAWTLLQLAASPLQFPQEAQLGGNVATSPPVCHLRALGVKASADSSAMHLPSLQTAEGSASRQASLQRYFEKKKDRYLQLSLQQASIQQFVCFLLWFLMFLLGEGLRAREKQKDRPVIAWMLMYVIKFKIRTKMSCQTEVMLALHLKSDHLVSIMGLAKCRVQVFLPLSLTKVLT